MAQVVHPKVWYPAGYPGPALNLGWISDVTDHPSDTTLVLVRFVDSIDSPAAFNKTDFYTAYDAYIASLP